eukprot:Em0008g353a
MQQYPKDSFPRIFWQQQMEAAFRKNARTMRWHPLMIRWCLSLRHRSSGAYEAIRDSECLKLPSQRTLRDYTHYVEAKCGFSVEIDSMLKSASKVDTCPEREKCTILLIDEMHIREDLVYDKHSSELIGFTNMANISNSLAQLERSMSENEVSETAHFIGMMDKFFDALNVHNFSHGSKALKPFQLPYTSATDFQLKILKWLKDTFLCYLKDWKVSVQDQVGISKSERNRMLLNDATQLGLEMTCQSFLDLVPFLFSMPDVEFFLSQRLCQDPLERFFGLQRQRGSVDENPNMGIHLVLFCPYLLGYPPVIVQDLLQSLLPYLRSGFQLS